MRIFLLLAIAAAAYAADPALIAKGATEERKACVGCHSARISSTQRLSRTGWERELDKMVRWGARIDDREALLAYLLDKYGDDKPAAPLPRSVDAPRK
jgi:mono/diheme cytochrome c family protein